MLTNLEIKNGVLSPEFDIYNDIYTVTIDSETDTLDFSYEVDESNVSIAVNGNENLSMGKKIVSIIVENEEVTKNIILNIVRTDVESTIGLQNYFESLEVKKQEKMPEYIGPMIGVICFLIIIVTFTILFHKKRKKN